MTYTIRAVIITTLAVTFAASAFAADDKPHRLAACKADVEKFCANEPRGQHKIRPCLEANKDKLSADCKTALENAGKQNSGN
jgi:hypothetical protein